MYIYRDFLKRSRDYDLERTFLSLLQGPQTSDS